MNNVERAIARYLTTPSRHFEPAVSDGIEQNWSNFVRPADVILIEGRSRVSSTIKYLTQSTWSHACLVVGLEPKALQLIEADLEHGVIASRLSKYTGLNVRICRPVRLLDNDAEAVVQFAKAQLGKHYDVGNALDLASYLLRGLPFPAQWRRPLLTYGSGKPSRAICSTLIAQAFQSIGYPILPHAWWTSSDIKHRRIIYQIKNYHSFTPRDFDLSPYFEVIKPTVRQGFDYHSMHWQQQSL